MPKPEMGMVLCNFSVGIQKLHGSKPPLIHQDVKSYAQYLLCLSLFHVTLFQHVHPEQTFCLTDVLMPSLEILAFYVELPRVVGDRTLLKAVRTERYYSPGLCEGLYSPKTDVYSYGVVSTVMNMNQDSYPMQTCVFLQVVLETYKWQKAYSTHRKD